MNGMAPPKRDDHPLVIEDPTPAHVKAALEPLGIVADHANRALVDADTPDDVIVTTQPRRPVPIADADLKITVPPKPKSGKPRHRLVTIGDSLTHGFHNFAVCNTDLSYPAQIAYELGSYDSFHRPRYDDVYGGLPLNLEYLARRLDTNNESELAGTPAILRGYHFIHEVANLWERASYNAPQHQWIVHNLAVFGWNLTDTITKSAADYDLWIQDASGGPNLPAEGHYSLKRLVQAGWHALEADTAMGKIKSHFRNAQARAAKRVLNPSGSPDLQKSTAFDLAQLLGDDGLAESPGAGDGIETLIIWLGSNNALGAVIGLKLNWTEQLNNDNTATPPGATVWKPDHFAQVLKAVESRARAVKARHVIWATVPHVTVAPLARGVGDRPEDSRYFTYYVRPWDDTAEGLWPLDRLTANQCRAIDSTIDQYNWLIEDVVRRARRDGLDWLLLDVAGFLDVLAERRYEHGFRGLALPSWWLELADEFQLPPQMVPELGFTPTTQFIHFDTNGAIDQGGIFSLDGVHATTVGYGAIAQRFIDVMQLHTDVSFQTPGGTPLPPGAIQIDFKRLLGHDSLISNPPASLDAAMHTLHDLDYVGLFRLAHRFL
jgi:hypothetical protein